MNARPAGFVWTVTWTVGVGEEVYAVAAVVLRSVWVSEFAVGSVPSALGLPSREWVLGVAVA